ncbi:uncharacterized protein LOC120081562 isoform X1 [Benincasa hispida]|uniref:uncharacterized protein LOC120081562 isoform X1 n=1 Tax=Benincasa hispida TaxID=102211 RepID=UPI0019027B5F|nr:uncharacterized protein LOC120081562 isoform X1 [Benincasa hispida]
MKLWRLRLPALLRCRENWTILEEPLSLRLRSLLFLKMAEYGEITADPTIESCSKEGCDSKFTKHFADDIIPHILNLYGSTATPRDFEIYAPDASFEDPLTRAYGVKEIKSAFYSLSKSVQDVLQRKGLPGGFTMVEVSFPSMAFTSSVWSCFRASCSILTRVTMVEQRTEPKTWVPLGGQTHSPRLEYKREAYFSKFPNVGFSNQRSSMNQELWNIMSKNNLFPLENTRL